jgi:hypothetical protein
MPKLQPAHRWIAAVFVAGALAACSAETTAPTAALDQAAVAQPGTSTVPSSRCDNPLTARFCPVAPALATANTTTLAASLRVRCEARRSSRSKISVDGFSVSPRNGSFRARVRAAGGSVTSGVRRAVGDQVEFDFDSDRGDIAAGATRIPARFIVARSGPDVVGELLNAQGRVLASQGVDCRIR